MALPLTRQEITALAIVLGAGLVGTSAMMWRASSARPPAVQAAPVNINTAPAEELERLPGIGPATARRIVDDRRQHGRFLRPEDLDRIKGISPRQVSRLKSSVTVE